MKYLVIKAFIDKETKKGYNQGGVYESDDSMRTAFLCENGYLKSQKKDEPEKEEAPKRSRKSKVGE